MKYLYKKIGPIAGGRIILLLLLALLGSTTVSAAGTNITLDFNSLPSAQGWTYEDNPAGTPETEVFSISGGVLQQDTTNTNTGEFKSWIYRLANVVDPSLPFVLSVRARVLIQENHNVGDLNNSFSFAFSVFTGSEFYGVGLGPNRIEDANGTVLSTTIDNTQFHNYRLEGTPGVGYQFFVDDTLVATGPPRQLSASNGLVFGDMTQGPNALGEWASYSFVQFMEVDIDIKPGSDPNCFNNNGHGVIPVAILSDANFDATQVDPSTVELDGQEVRVVGKKDNIQAHQEDVDGDGLVDLVVQIEDVGGIYQEGDTMAILSGNLFPEFGGISIEGTDSICIVP